MRQEIIELYREEENKIKVSKRISKECLLLSLVGCLGVLYFGDTPMGYVNYAAAAIGGLN